MAAPDYAAEIAALEAAAASGVLTVEADGERLTYKSTADVLKAVEYFKARAAAAAAPVGAATSAFGFSAVAYERE